MNALERVETPRMVLERLRPEHAPHLIALLTDPRVARTTSPTLRPPSDARVIENLNGKLDHWQRFGFGMWLMRDRETLEPVGRGGLQHTFVGGSAEVEAGWALVPSRWGQGLATELANASVEAGLGPLRLKNIVAFAFTDNIASRRVMEKAGFAYERDIKHAGRPHALYRIDRRVHC